MTMSADVERLLDMAVCNTVMVHAARTKEWLLKELM